ncbi:MULTISPECIES: TonB-dependent receptor [unclassified Novosphingobium]|uniref:TonB-dependent receptor n=1 Tax=unclassified Novosphingobium TaxID=2644732 RepID=UPI0025DE2F4B|nr:MULTISPECIES: TonB-dependent receptor [unclassified Novosphingobium]
MNKKTFSALRASAAPLALVIAGFAASAAFVAPAMAQDFTNATASGQIVGEDDAPIAGATVEIRSNDQGFTRSVTTDSSGNYRIPTLPQGTYTFTVTADGYSTFTDPAVRITQSEGGNSFRLAPAGAGTASADGSIVVTGQRIRVSDFDRTTTGQVISVADVAERIPVARDLTSVILLAPGTSQGDSAFGSLPSISGGSVSENTFFVNGLNITDFREGLGSVTVPFEFYQTVEVKNGGVPAEFGRFTGGFINAVTKSGGNEFHGGILVNWQPDGLTEDRKNTLIDQNDQDSREQIQAIFSLSGPIIKDRLFFYGFYQTNYNKFGDTQLTTNPNTTIDDPASADPLDRLQVQPYSTGLRRLEDKIRSPFYGGKLDFLPFDGHRLEFTYFNSTQQTYRDSFGVTDTTGGGYDSRVDTGVVRGAYQSTAIIEEGGENFVGRYTGQLTDFLTISGAYGKNKSQYIAGSSQPNYPFISDTSGNFSPALSGNPIQGIETNLDTREFYRGDVELFVNAFGEHHFKAGYDRENLTTDSTSSYTGNVAYTYVNSGSGDVYVTTPNTLYVTGRTFINGGVFTSRNEAFYLQDSWSLFDNRLVLNLGVRNDRFSNNNVNGETYYKSGNQWAPRLAATFDPFGDKRTKIYGSYGRYFLPVVANTNIRLAGAELDYTRYNLVSGVNPDGTPILGAPVLGFADAAPCPDTNVRNCDIISDGVATPTIATVSKNLRPQSVDEFVLGFEHQLGNGIRVGLFGQYRKLNDSLEDIAIDAAVNKYCDDNSLDCTTASGSPIWSGFHQYVLANPGRDAQITLSDPVNGETTLRTIDFSAADLGYPRARRTYKAITATFDRDFDGTWSLSASYTWSKSEGNIEGGIRSDNSQTDSGLTTAFDQPGLVNGAYGYLPSDARHKFKVFGSYKIADWLTLGTQFQAVSPRKFGCIGRVPVSVDPFAGAYGAAGFYCNVDSSGNVITNPAFKAFQNNAAGTSLSLTPRGSQLESDWNIFTNVSAVFTLPTDAFEGTFRVDVFNVFNQQGVLDVRELGTQGNGRPRGDYGTPLSYQQPRFFRFQFGINF